MTRGVFCLFLFYAFGCFLWLSGHDFLLFLWPGQGRVSSLSFHVSGFFWLVPFLVFLAAYAIRLSGLASLAARASCVLMLLFLASVSFGFGSFVYE